MSVLTLGDQKIWFAEYELTGLMNSVAIDNSREMQDCTTFGKTTKGNKSGMKSAAISVEGFFDADPYDEALYNYMGAADKPVSVSATGSNGETAFFMQAVEGEYSPGGSVGELLKFSAKADCSSGDLIRGTMMVNGAQTSTGSGTAYTLGAATSTQKIYGALHVTEDDFSSLDVIVESSATGAWGGEETTRLTFSNASEITSEWVEDDGPITDTYWRVSWTMTGTSATFAVLFGIQ